MNLDMHMIFLYLKKIRFFTQNPASKFLLCHRVNENNFQLLLDCDLNPSESLESKWVKFLSLEIVHKYCNNRRKEVEINVWMRQWTLWESHKKSNKIFIRPVSSSLSRLSPEIFYSRMSEVHAHIFHIDTLTQETSNFSWVASYSTISNFILTWNKFFFFFFISRLFLFGDDDDDDEEKVFIFMRFCCARTLDEQKIS